MNDFNILAIGNSFSTDSTHYIHQIAEAGGVEVKVVNLYIGDVLWNAIGRTFRRTQLVPL